MDNNETPQPPVKRLQPVQDVRRRQAVSYGSVVELSAGGADGRNQRNELKREGFAAGPSSNALDELAGEPVGAEAPAHSGLRGRLRNLGVVAKTLLLSVNVSRVLLLASMPLIALALVVVAGFGYDDGAVLLLALLTQCVLLMYLIILPMILGFNRWAAARDVILALILLAFGARLALPEVWSAPHLAADPPAAAVF